MTGDLDRVGAGQLATGGQDLLVRYTDDWLDNKGYAAGTRAGYRVDVLQWLDWCSRRAVPGDDGQPSPAPINPLEARFTHVNAFARRLEERMAPTTVARKLSAVSSWYTFLVRLGVLASNPAGDADRPKVDRDYTATASLTEVDATAVLREAVADGPRSAALFGLLLHLGVRVSEACGATVGDLGWREGHRVLLVHGKGRKRIVRALPAPTARAVDRYLVWRAEVEGVAVEDLTGPLLVTSGGRALDRAYVFRTLRRLARRAGVVNAEVLSPHVLRHTWNATARRRRASLEARQIAMGHADPRTTRRYDQAARSLDEDPAYLVAAAVSQDDGAG